MIVAGIDPGLKGGLVALNFVGRVVTVLPLANGLDWLMQQTPSTPMHVFLEQAQAMPGQGVTGMFNYGRGFGKIEGVLFSRAIAHTQVRPSAWMKVMHEGTRMDATKKRSLEAAERLFPSETWMMGKQKTPQSGLYEAALIASYGLRVLTGGAPK